VEDKEAMRQLACANCYFMCQDGSTFKAQVKYQPYMYIRVKVRYRPL
jgi:DNA polymerase epsilon subunit 1